MAKNQNKPEDYKPELSDIIVEFRDNTIDDVLGVALAAGTDEARPGLMQLVVVPETSTGQASTWEKARRVRIVATDSYRMHWWIQDRADRDGSNQGVESYVFGEITINKAYVNDDEPLALPGADIAALIPNKTKTRHRLQVVHQGRGTEKVETYSWRGNKTEEQSVTHMRLLYGSKMRDTAVVDASFPAFRQLIPSTEGCAMFEVAHAQIQRLERIWKAAASDHGGNSKNVPLVVQVGELSAPGAGTLSWELRIHSDIGYEVGGTWLVDRTDPGDASVVKDWTHTKRALAADSLKFLDAVRHAVGAHSKDDAPMLPVSVWYRNDRKPMLFTLGNREERGSLLMPIRL